ncbi:MAG TPA: hypothetical protein VI306_10050 [Pyrinomonadaceae bacterium]
MITRRFLITIAVLVCAQTTFAQFGNNNSQSYRLNELAGTLARQANDFADSNYRSYSNSVRSNRSDLEAVMLTEQFSGAAKVFAKMVSDRRRNSDLRDAFGLLQDLARSVERNNLQRSTWYNVQRTLQDIDREIGTGNGIGNGPGNGDGYPDQGRGGRITWRGRVDDNVRIVFRGGTADLETVGGTPYYDAQPNFINQLPNRRVNVVLTVKRGRGQVTIEQQPSRENDFAAIIRIRDTKGGADTYEFELSW